MAKILCVPAISDIDDVVGYVNARGVYLKRMELEFAGAFPITYMAWRGSNA